jgi:peroxiredoxin
MKRLLLLTTVVIIALSFVAIDSPTGLNVGDMAPNFTSKDQYGKEVNLKKLLKKGTVVLLFYRGEWCPYCNRELKTFEDSLSLITAKGAHIIAVSPEKTENVTKTIEKTKASYSIVSDDSAKIMNAYKVTYEVDTNTTKKLKGYGVDLTRRNGTNGNRLPVPAVYIIDKSGKITYRYFDVDYRKRASVKEIVSNL